MVTAPNIEEAAKSVGIGPEHAAELDKVPEFQAEYREARRAAYSQAVAKLQQGARAAATTLLKVKIDSSTPTSVKVRAASVLGIDGEDGSPGRKVATLETRGGVEPVEPSGAFDGDGKQVVWTKMSVRRPKVLSPLTQSQRAE